MVSIYRMTEQRQKFLGVFYLKLPADHARFYRFTELVDVAQNPSFAFSQELYSLATSAAQASLDGGYKCIPSSANPVIKKASNKAIGPAKETNAEKDSSLLSCLGLLKVGKEHKKFGINMLYDNTEQTNQKQMKVFKTPP